jgi:hypothetical protein
MSDSSGLLPSLVGRWQKVSGGDSATNYPDQLEFNDRGRYVGTNNPGSRIHPIWDVGTSRPKAPNRLQLTHSNDQEVEYGIRVSTSELTFVTPQLDEIRYRKV